MQQIAEQARHVNHGIALQIISPFGASNITAKSQCACSRVQIYLDSLVLWIFADSQIFADARVFVDSRIFADLRMFADSRIHGFVDLQMCGFAESMADSRMRRFVDLRIQGLVDSRIRGFAIPRF